MFSATVQARSSVLYWGTTPMWRRALGGCGDDVDAGDGDLAAGGQGAGGADGDGGGFAGAVGAEQAVDGAGSDVEVDTVDGGDGGLAGVDFSQRADFNDHVNTIFLIISMALPYIVPS